MNKIEFLKNTRAMVANKLQRLRDDLVAIDEALDRVEEAQAPSGPKLGWVPLDQLCFGRVADPMQGSIEDASLSVVMSHAAIYGAHRAFVRVATNDNGHSFTLVTRGPAE